MVEIAHPVADSAELLGDEVLGLDRAGRDARRVEAQDFVLPRREGLGEAGELGDVGLGDMGVEADETPVGLTQCRGGVAFAQQLLSVNRPSEGRTGTIRHADR